MADPMETVPDAGQPPAEAAPPGPYTVRPAKMHEAAAIASMIAVCDRSVGVPPTTVPSDLLDDWRRADFELRTDSWVVESPHAEIVAYATITCEGPRTFVSFAVVHPDHCERGLGNSLIDRIEERAVDHPRWEGSEMTLLNVILAEDDAARSLLDSRSYSKERTFHRMEIVLAGFSQSVPQEQIEIRPFDAGRDREVMHEVLESAFARHWDFSPTPFHEWWEQHSGGDDFDPTLWWWAVVGGERAGALVGTVRDDRGWVVELGVLERWRGRGIGVALLEHSFAEFRLRGFERVGLSVDSQNETGATRLYERVGMSFIHQLDFYKKVLPGPVAATYRRSIGPPFRPLERLERDRRALTESSAVPRRQ
jgi:mycothiol synthase